jgi:hypothetical protein
MGIESDIRVSSDKLHEPKGLCLPSPSALGVRGRLVPVVFMCAAELEEFSDTTLLQTELFLNLPLHILSQGELWFCTTLRKLPVPSGTFALSEE